VQKTSIKEGEEPSPALQHPRPLLAVQALPTPCRGGRRRTPTQYTPVNEDLATSTPEMGPVQAESIQKTANKEGEEPSSAKQKAQPLHAALPTPCRGGRSRTPPLHYVAVNEAETIQNAISREGEEQLPARLLVRFDSFEASDTMSTDHLARPQWIMPGKIRFYATVAAVLAPVVVLLVAVIVFFDPGHHAFHDDLTARPVSANLQGLVMPGAQQTEGSKYVTGVRSSMPLGPALSHQPMRDNDEKAFDFRPRFYNQGDGKDTFTKAPTNLAGGLPRPLASGHDSWLRQRRPLTVPEDYPAVIAAAETAGAATLHAKSSLGTTFRGKSSTAHGAPVDGSSQDFPLST